MLLGKNARNLGAQAGDIWVYTGHCAVLLLALSLGACASGGPAPRSPEVEQESADAPTDDEMASASNDETDAASDETADSSSASSGSSELASAEDLAQALQVVIADDALLGELKLGEPNRFPLKITGSQLSAGLKLLARNEMVEVVELPKDTKATPVLVFLSIDLNAKTGTFKYRYDAEGVRGTSHVYKNSVGVWELKSSRVSEY